MEKLKLGRTGLEVSRLGLGGLFISRFGADFEEARRAVHRAVELGVNYIDTAPGYADSEEVLGRCLAGIDAPLVISTKLGGRPLPFDPRDSEGLRRSVEESLRLLGRDVIDILMIHEPDRPGQYDWWADPVNFESPVMEVLDELKERGVIRFTGLGGTTAYEIVPIIRTGRFDVLLTAFNYSLLYREAAIAAIPAAVEEGMGVVVGSPLQQGALARRRDDEVARGARWLSPPRRKQFKALYRLCDETGMSLPEMGLRFVISNGAVHCVLSGARSAREAEENIAHVEKGPLEPGLISRVDEIAAMVPFRPFEEPFSLPFGREYRGPGIA